MYLPACRLLQSSRKFRLLRPIFKFYSTNNKPEGPTFSGSSIVYVEQLYNTWRMDPGSVHPSWNDYFTALGGGEALKPQPQTTQTESPPSSTTTPSSSALTAPKGERSSAALNSLIRAYQHRGHLLAAVDPLGLNKNNIISHDIVGTKSSILGKPKYDKTEMDRIFQLPQNVFFGGNKKEMSLRNIIAKLENIYCRHIGAEIMHLNSYQELLWLQEQLETPKAGQLNKQQKRLIMARLCRTHGFENFLSRKWPAEKRFGVEGCEVLIPAIKQIIDVSTINGVESVNIAMAHRGRLNVLANVCRIPLADILCQFNADLSMEDEEDAGDVKYHLGTSVQRTNRATNKKVKISVLANPSHLESACPECQGKTRAEQFYRNDEAGKQVMSIFIHGDAAFCGQGVVFETVHLSDLPAYTTHGAIHIVINNQIGFTTDPRSSRSSAYCTGVGHVVNNPIFHVNGDDPESVIHVCNIASNFRAKFHKDVIIDIVCYRRNGHNESDEPMFTQPIMYAKIKNMQNVFEKYYEQLINEDVVTQDEVRATIEEYDRFCEEAYKQSRQVKKMNYKMWLDSPWDGFFVGKDPLFIPPTGIASADIQHIAKKFSSPPPKEFNMVIHRGIERILRSRAEMIKNGVADWAIAEALAFGSLLKEGIHIRLSGQDVERGTFSHRHHVIHHQTVDLKVYNPLTDLYPDQAKYSVSNSSLSEYAVLGFELGYSKTNPYSLVLWEAQFGDFSNVAQCIIDQFLASGEAKWIRQAGIVLLLPHGMEGMGPEHSSCRPERFLQMCNDDPDEVPVINETYAQEQLQECNWIIVNCTTPANYFHVLRRQIAMPFRKPLIVLSPKSLLRHPKARSQLTDFKERTEFQRVIPENGEASKDPANVKKFILCSGKVYYDLIKERDEKGLNKDIAITRIEQLAPFPYDIVQQECEKYKNAVVTWAQEEHKNQGPWSFIQPRFYTATLGTRELYYAGRNVSPSPATGLKSMHNGEQKRLLKEAMYIF